MSEIKIIGHRGLKGYEPENTLRAFKKGVELGVKCFELDIYNVEGRAIVFHDCRLERCTNGSGRISEKSLEYLRNLDAGSGEKIPFLEEVLELCGPDIEINIELKGLGTTAIVAEVVNKFMKKPGWSNENFLISSFDHTQLVTYNELAPNLRLGALSYGIPAQLAKFGQDLNAFSVHQSLDFITEDFVADAHKRDLKVYVYTVNEPDDFIRMRDMNIDGIFSDYPDRAMKILRA